MLLKVEPDKELSFFIFNYSYDIRGFFSADFFIFNSYEKTHTSYFNLP